MPGYDRSGPMGEGPMSGGGQGLCGSNQIDQAPAGYGRMAGRGAGGGGGGFGFRGGMRGGSGRRAGMRSFGQRMKGDTGDGDNLKSQVGELRKVLTAIDQQLVRINQKDE